MIPDCKMMELKKTMITSTLPAVFSDTVNYIAQYCLTQHKRLL